MCAYMMMFWVACTGIPEPILLGVFLNHSPPYFWRQSLSVHGACQVCYTGWPLSSRDLSQSLKLWNYIYTFPLCTLPHTQHLLLLLTLVLGIKLGSTYLLGKHFPPSSYLKESMMSREGAVIWSQGPCRSQRWEHWDQKQGVSWVIWYLKHSPVQLPILHSLLYNTGKSNQLSVGCSIWVFVTTKKT